MATRKEKSSRRRQTPRVFVIAGANGAGKTTFAREFLPNYAACENFINADLIASGLSPFAPQTAAVRAARFMVHEIRALSRAGRDFGFETTLSGRTHLQFFRALRKQGYRIHLFYLWLPSIELALQRVATRVRDGGHAVPAKDVRRHTCPARPPRLSGPPPER